MTSPALYRLVVVLALISSLHSKICPTTDIRSELEEFEKLRNCTVIRGNLVIVLLDTFPADDFEKYSFPELTEITGYFLMWRVFGIRSLGHLFPNLSVIRGKQLLRDFSFILFELLDLKEVGHLHRNGVEFSLFPAKRFTKILKQVLGTFYVHFFRNHIFAFKKIVIIDFILLKKHFHYMKLLFPISAGWVYINTNNMPTQLFITGSRYSS